MIQPGRKYSATNSYMYGFNGKENDNDVKGEGMQLDYGFRIYDPRLGRFFSVDPLMTSFPWNSPYSYAEGDPVNYIDLDGAEKNGATAQSTQTQAGGISNISDPFQANRDLAAKLQQATSEVINHQKYKTQALLNLKIQQEHLTKEYEAWRKTASFGTPTPDKFKSLVQSTPPQSYTQGGIAGSEEFKIFKANYDTYGKYLPGISDIDDGLTFIGNLSDGNYKQAAFSAIMIIPGGDFFKPLKALKGAGKFGGTACMDYVGDFMKKYAKKVEDAGGTVKKMEINMGNGWIGIGTGQQSKRLSETGLHQFIEVADKSGTVKIFDNAHPDGILKSEYLKTIAGSNATDSYMDGAKLYEKYAKQLNK